MYDTNDIATLFGKAFILWYTFCAKIAFACWDVKR